MGGEEGVPTSLWDEAGNAGDCSNATSGCTMVQFRRYMDYTIVYACCRVRRVSLRKDWKGKANGTVGARSIHLGTCFGCML